MPRGGVILLLCLCFLAVHSYSVESDLQKEVREMRKLLNQLVKERGLIAQGQQIQANSGLTYICWGRTTCPNTPGTQLVYDGFAGGAYYDDRGGGSNYLCMPKNPDYTLPFQYGVRDHSYIHGAEYQNPIRGIYNHNVPCAVCYTSRRGTVLKIPAKAYCPQGWTREYYGYLMSEYKGHYRTMYECVDRYPESVPGSYRDENGVLFHHVEAACNGLPCPPYDPNKELNCVVCTK